ncbi:MAG TPA: hypothetical protein VM915_07365 [Verrucomicrobiae bacterium]|jgi:hypothetical protein|nr:hypothetical protein [Verrucomicrobiae bacterium]
MDLSLNLGDFNATTALIAAVTPAGRDFLGHLFGFGAASINLPKSKVPEFSAFAATKGIRLG